MIVALHSSMCTVLLVIKKLILKDTILACDLNAVFSCSTVLSAWQSSVFGFPNSVMCLVLFTVFAAIALAGAAGAVLPKGLRLGIQALSLGTLGFGLWFIEQSIFSIGSLCVLCTFCIGGLLVVNWGWLRINNADLPFGARMIAAVQRAIAKDVDILVWVAIAVIIAAVMIVRFS